MLDALARRYHTDPGTVMEWSPARLGVAMLAMEAGMMEEGRRVREASRDGGAVFPVVVLGG